MKKYNLTCDNGQVMEMNVDLDIPGVTLEGEIEKLKGLFVQLAADKAATGQHPAGWLDPLPTDVVSWEEVNE